MVESMVLWVTAGLSAPGVHAAEESARPFSMTQVCVAAARWAAAPVPWPANAGAETVTAAATAVTERELTTTRGRTMGSPGDEGQDRSPRRRGSGFRSPRAPYQVAVFTAPRAVDAGQPGK